MNKKKSNLWKGTLSMLLWISSVCMFAQNITVQGTITDTQGKPLIGASIQVQGETTGTVTDTNGKFTLTNIPSNSILEISYLGMISQTIALNGETMLNIVLQEDIETLEEVVIIGYGAVKKKDLLGAVSVVKEDALAERVSGNIIESMRGLTSGVKITSSGQPGSNASIIIRGLGSLTNNNPLFIIDGAYGGSDLGVNVEDIESIQILKDASSAAIYGSRAANGVVIITTKQGKEGPLKVKFNSQLELNWLPRYDLMDASTYKIYNDRAYEEAILAGVGGITKRQNHFDGDTDWQEEMLGTGMLQNYNISLSGGSNTVRYYASLNRMIDDGALYRTGYDKYGFRINTSGRKEYSLMVRTSIIPDQTGTC